MSSANRAARRRKPRAAGRSRVPLPVARLASGDIGYFADPRRWDDCLRASVATVTQVPMEQVPDPQLHTRLLAGEDPDEISDETWERFARWADRRGLRMMLHVTVPADRERWIGVCEDTPRWNEPWRLDEPNPFADHCLILSYDRVIFDPAAKANVPPGMELRTWGAGDVTYGISFDPQEKE